jgi:hypothetical protein
MGALLIDARNYINYVSVQFSSVRSRREKLDCRGNEINERVIERRRQGTQFVRERHNVISEQQKEGTAIFMSCEREKN